MPVSQTGDRKVRTTVRHPTREGHTMYALLRSVRDKRAALVEIPSCLASLAIAEAFYRFHSFTLECVAFLATWLAVGAVARWVSAPAG